MSGIETLEVEARAKRECKALIKQVMMEETKKFLEENHAKIIERAEARVRKIAEESIDEEVKKLIVGEKEPSGAQLP